MALTLVYVSNRMEPDFNIEYSKLYQDDKRSDDSFDGSSNLSHFEARAQPNENDVVCGSRKSYDSHPGNRYFKALVKDAVPEYIASLRCEKSVIISRIIKQIRSNSSSGGFVQLDPVTGMFTEVDDHHAREKTSQAFRNELQNYYKSSSASRQRKRVAERLRKNDICRVIAKYDESAISDHNLSARASSMSLEFPVRYLSIGQERRSDNDSDFDAVKQLHLVNNPDDDEAESDEEYCECVEPFLAEDPHCITSSAESTDGDQGNLSTDAEQCIPSREHSLLQDQCYGSKDTNMLQEVIPTASFLCSLFETSESWR